MNVYDFDKTIYDGDSTVDFYLFCLSRRPWVIIKFPVLTALRYLICRDEEHKLLFKERFYRFLRAFDDIDSVIYLFWDRKKTSVKPWYLEQKKPDDVIISASPEFLLRPICARLGVTVLASRVNKNTGLYDGVNCWGREKVRRFYEKYPHGVIDEFYSDSYSDAPLASLAKSAYLVKKFDMIPW